MHKIYFEEYRVFAWYFTKTEDCNCNIGKNHWAPRTHKA